MRIDPALRGMVTTLFLDAAPTVVVYFAAQLLGVGVLPSLLAAGAASALRVLWTAVRQRSLNPVALFLTVAFGAGVVLALTSGDPRFMLAKDSVTTALAGLVLVGSCALGRPIPYLVAKRAAERGGGEQLERFRSRQHDPVMRHRWRQVALVWGVGLLGDSAVRAALIYLAPIAPAAAVSQLLIVVSTTGLAVWTVVTGRRTARVTTRVSAAHEAARPHTVAAD